MSAQPEDDEKERAINSLVGWMENLDDCPPDELREIRRDLGHDVERSEREFLDHGKPVRCPECGSKEHGAAYCDNMG